MKLRSKNGGSIEPFIVHLFKGGLIFESLLKKKYADTAEGNTLGSYLNEALADLELGTHPIYRRRSSYTLSDVINLLPVWNSESFQEKAVAVAYTIRNTTGHDLAWPDQFNINIYDEIFESLLNAILWVIWKLEVS
ncbi:unnamed protein product [marine sediment metagenome]|uniref:DUF4145 domain-containing protein n=1 Tax=marine sediment metagenome TaxID=412755 RepID=X0SA65_9ZZZZ